MNQIKSSKIPYHLHRSPKVKNLRIIIDYSGTVKVVAPTFLSQEKILDFLELKKRWIESKLKIKRGNTSHFFSKFNRTHYLNHKESARKLVKIRVDYWQEIIGCKVNDIKIKDLKTKWGSCSTKSNINFNYRLVFLPQELHDYIIVHELCHLIHLNHSDKFWSLVENHIPNYREVIKRINSR